MSPHQGNRHVGLALALTRELPHTMAALSAGRISEWRATVVARETAVLSAAHRTDLDRQLADKLTQRGWGDRQVGSEARRIGYRLDPGATVARNRRAAADRRVSLRPAPDAMSYLTALLPVAEGVACYAALAHAADTAHASAGGDPTGKPRGRGQVMADTLVDRVTGGPAPPELPSRSAS